MTTLSPEQAPQPTEPLKSSVADSSGSVGKKPASPSSTGRPRFEAAQLKPLPKVIQVLPLLAEILITAAGSLILWWGAEGNGVIHANQLSMTVFILILTAVMTGRGFILAMLKTSQTALGTLPALTRWLATVRNIGLVALAVYSKYLAEYIGQWIIAFAAIVLAATALTGLVLAVIRRESPANITSRFLDSGAGILAMVFTQGIHGWDQLFLSTLVSITLVPAFFAWGFTTSVRKD
jgi:hypothetical protein